MIALRTACGMLALSLFSACSSTPPGELTKKQKLDFYMENAGRYYELGEVNRCLDQVTRGLEIDPDNERFLLMKGRCHQIRGTSDDIAIAEKLFRDHPAQDDYRIQLGLAGALERKGVLFDVSGREIRSGDRYTPAKDPEARADDLAKRAIEAWEESAEHYALAAEYYSGGFEALNGQMRVTRFLGKSDLALDHARALIESIQTSNRLFRTQEEEQEAKGESTVDTRRTLLDNQELEVWIRLEIAEILKGQDRDQEALEELDIAYALEPDIKDLHSRRGQLLFEMGRYERAKSALERFLKLSEDPFDHPDIQRTYDLIQRCDMALAEAP